MADRFYLAAPGDSMLISEREFLRELAEKVERAFGHRAVIVNIGVGWGASLHCLRAGAPRARLIGIDIDLQTRKLVGDPGAELIEDDSYVQSRLFEGKVHLVFVDGDHRFQAVMKDITGWAPKVVCEGFIVFHDYSPSPRDLERQPELAGVKQAVELWRSAGGKEWREAGRSGSIIAFRRVQCGHCGHGQPSDKAPSCGCRYQFS